MSYFEREPSYPSRRETLQYFLEDLQAKLEELDEIRPHDPQDPDYDRYFYSGCIVHYNENPCTVQDVLYGIREVTELIQALDEEGSVVRAADPQVPGQISYELLPKNLLASKAEVA